MRKNLLLASVAIMVALASTTAGAQTTGDSASDKGVEDIIVTAQRFSESAQKTPLVIETISGDELIGISDVRQLSTQTPGIQLSPAGNVVQTFVRGVGTLAATNSQEGAIAYNVDGVFLFTTTMISPLIYDLERVEVLKGPQGTLYGRNASGGAVNLITTGARIGRTEGYVEAEAGNYDLLRATGALNLPLGDNAAIRFAGQHVQHDGYLSDGTDDQKLTSGRVRLRWEPSTAVTLQVGADISHTGGHGAGASITPNPTDDKFIGGADPRLQTGSPFVGGTSLLSFPPNAPARIDDDQWSVHAQLDADLGFATLTVLPAFRREKIDTLTYIPGYAFGEVTTSKQKSIETRLGDKSDALKWVLGAYYFKLDQDSSNFLNNDVNHQGADVTLDNSIESYAFFGEATFSVADTVRLIGGLRYTHEKTASVGIANANDGPPGLLNPVTGLPNVQTPAYNPFSVPGNLTGELLDYPVNNSSRAEAVTWKVGAEFDVAPESLLFATVSRGFKGGGTYVDIPGIDSSFKPEYLTAFEFGSRNRFLDNSLQLNFGAFYWKLKNQQVPYVGFNPIGQVTFLTKNAGRANMYGANIDLTYRPTQNDTFHVGAEYLKSEYDVFVRNVPSLAILPNTDCAVSGYDPTPGSLQPAVLDCSGLPLLHAPKWSGSASYDRRFDLGGDSDIRFGANIVYTSANYLDANYTPLMKQKSSALVGLQLGYNSPGGRFNVTAWVRNLFNDRIKTGGGQFLPFYVRPTLQPPRTVGVSARVNF